MYIIWDIQLTFMGGTLKKVLVSLIIVFSILVLYRMRSSTPVPSVPTPPATTLDPFYVEDFEFWPSNTVSGSLSEIQFSWPVVHQEDGLIVYKEEGQEYNYLFAVDPGKKTISVKNLFGDMDQHWKQAVNPICVINGGFFEPDGSPSFPLIENSQFLPGVVIRAYPVRILYINYGLVLLSDIKTNEEALTSQWAISGLNPSYYRDSTTVTNRTIVGTKDNLLYILVTRNRTVDSLVTLMQNDLKIDPSLVLALDSGYSSQVRCFGQDLLRSKSVMGSTLIISNP